MPLKKILENSLENILKKENNIEISNLDDNLKSYLILSLLNFTNYPNNPLILFTSEESRLNFLFNTLTYWNSFLSKITRSKPTPIYKYIVHNKDIESEKENISNSIITANLFSKQKGIYLFPIESITDKTLPTSQYNKNIIKVSRNQNINLDELFNNLINIGYKSEKNTLIPGYIEKKGGILNIFPINFKHPIQIDLFGNKIESIKTFDIKSKESKKLLELASIYPLKTKSLENNNNSLILDYLDIYKPNIILDNPNTFENYLDYDQSDKLLNFQKITNKCKQIIFNNLPLNTETRTSVSLNYQKIIPYRNNIERFKNDILKKQKDSYQIIIVTNFENQFKNIFNSLNNINFIRKKKVNFDNINLVSGFENKKTKTLLIFDKEILGEEINTKKRNKIDQVFISELNPGNFIVHIDHGIGIFQGVVQREVDEGIREFLILEYAQGDKLYLPAEYTDKVSKYIGAGKPKINRLHEMSWKELRKKVKEDAEKQAKELLQVYAQRESSSGFIFSKNNLEEKQLASSFKYTETPDQLKTIEEIKTEMEGNNIASKEFNIKKPMDRLVCGDVGFGKTEVAVRASFKATQDKKQVAILCPTTLLAEQHYETFSKRLNNFNVKIEVLSRFKTKKEQKEIVWKLASGKIDIIIGTHRLLSKDIKFSDLGLIIVDEEQRFGVKHKEKLKKIRPHVDIITLSATPIPRTLNLALSKLKNISILETPPQGRQAVETFITPHNDEKIIEAIQFEIKRGGQVYYLHNRVKTINIQLKRLKKLMPSTRFGIIHGQLSEKEIACIMKKFNKKREIDVLICSSIIENGLDLPNVNTLIVDNAIMFGLADLHQLRGRIGRSKRKAYAYFFYKSQKLKEKARRRLEALLSAKELGAGFQIAMQDLEIRGAGNILGKQQSGNIKSVGLNLYCQLLNQAVKEIKTGKSEELAIDITIDLPITAYIPEILIKDSKKRIKLYQELAKIHNLEDLEAEKNQISNKYKNFPTEFKNLFKILQLKILAKNANIKSIDTKKIIKYGDEIYRLTLEFKKIPPFKKMKVLIKNKVDFSITDNLLKIDSNDLDKNKLFRLLKNSLITLK